MFNLLLKYVLATSMAIFSSVSFAATEYMPKPEFVAETAVNYINRFANLGEMMKDLKPYIDANELKDWESRLTSYGIKMTDKLPKFKAMGSDIIMGDGKLTVTADGRVSIKGKIYDTKGKKLGDMFNEVAGDAKKKTASHFSLFPEANAFVGPGMFAGLGTAMAIGAAAVVVVLVGAVVGTVYMTKSMYEAWRDGEAFCTPDGKFNVRKKTSGTLGLATSESFILNNQAVSAIIRRQVTKCDEASLKDLQRNIRQMSVREVDREQMREETGSAR